MDRPAGVDQVTGQGAHSTRGVYWGYPGPVARGKGHVPCLRDSAMVGANSVEEARYEAEKYYCVGQRVYALISACKGCIGRPKL